MRFPSAFYLVRVPELLVVLLLTAFVAPSCRSQQSPGKGADEVQRDFGAEIEVRRPVGIQRRRFEGIEKRLRCSVLPDLNEDQREDLIVVGRDGCLAGANILPFWILRNTSDGYAKALSVRALHLSVAESKTLGYSDISAAAVVGLNSVVTLTYKFNGKEYELAGRAQEEIK